MGLLNKVNKPKTTTTTMTAFSTSDHYIRVDFEPNFVESIEQRLGDILNSNSIKEANQLMAIAYKYGTPAETLRNKYAISYNACVCCGEQKAGEETPLIEERGIVIPVCIKCRETDYIKSIDWYKVATIYNSYAKNTEGAANYYDEIR
jgi:hypothetical protein